MVVMLIAKWCRVVRCERAVKARLNAQLLMVVTRNRRLSGVVSGVAPSAEANPR